MLKKTITFFHSLNTTHNWKTVFLVFFLIAFFVRFPFFFRDYVDRDESTFIIMAQSWVDGHLPYTLLWDLKPPITFLVFALSISVFGKSFLAIRLFGTIMVALSSLFTYGIATRITTKKVGYWCAVFCVFFQSLFGSLQGVMSEHICTLFFVMAVYLLLSKKTRFWYVITGVLFGLSVMSKLNMAYPLLTLGLYLIWSVFIDSKKWRDFESLIFIGIGFAVLVALTALPYYLQGELSIWWQSIFEAPLAYSNSKFHSMTKALPLVLATLILLSIGVMKKLIDIRSREIQVLIVVIIGVLVSFIQTGKVNGHYLIQLYPFLLIPAAIAIGKLPSLGKRMRVLAGVFLILIPMESYLEYANIVDNKMRKGTFFNGEGIDIPAYIQANNLETDNIFFTEYHIGYWVLGANPPTKAATHPSNIAREELFPFMQNTRQNGLEELKFIMEDLRPSLVVTHSKSNVFDGRMRQMNTYVKAYLKDYYTLLKTIDRGHIYQRLE